MVAVSDAPIRADDAHRLESGHYVPVTSNEESVCPQEVRAHYADNELVEIRVAYVGDCYYDGPYSYPCDGVSCGLPGIEFQIHGPRSYTWRNTDFDIVGEFRKRDARR